MGIGDNFDVKTAGSVDSTYTKNEKKICNFKNRRILRWQCSLN